MGNLISTIKYDSNNIGFIKKNKNNKQTRTRRIITPEFISSPHLPIPMNL